MPLAGIMSNFQTTPLIVMFASIWKNLANSAAVYRLPFAILSVLLCAPLFAIEDELQQVRTFADRGRFDVVETICQEVFERPEVTNLDKTRLAAELVRARSMLLLSVESSQQSAIVRRLESLESTLLAGSADTAAPDLAFAKITLRLQLAMAYQSLGDYQRLEADIASAVNMLSAYRRARTTLHDAIERLKFCRREFQSLRLRIGNNADSQWRQRLLALEYSITMQQGIAQKSLAMTFTSESERNFELGQAAETLSELASVNSTDSVIVQCKVEKAACHRLAGELERCAEILSQLRDTSVSLSPESRLRVEAEWIRYNIAARTNIAELRRQYAADHPDARLYPDFDLARLELFLMNDTARNVRPEHAAARQLQDTIGRELATYWGRRANMTVSAMTLGSTDLASADMLATTAENLYREERYSESAEMYEQAAARADANRQAEEMYRFNRLAVAAWAQVLERLPAGASGQEYEDRLIPLLQKLARQNPNHPEACGFHVKTIQLLEQRIAEHPEVLDECAALIKEHAELWGESPALPVLRRILIIHLEQRGRTGEAAALLPLLDLDQIGVLPAEIQRLRVRQLDTEGKTQEAVGILTALLEQRHDPVTLQLFAEILSRQTDVKSLNDALKYWTELADVTARDSESWWSAREGVIDVLFKLNRREEAKQSFASLSILYPALGGAERKERLMKRFESP